MTSREFCYWLQGRFEIPNNDGSEGIAFTEKQEDCIKIHMRLVYAMNEINPEPQDSETMKFVNELRSYFESLHQMSLPKSRVVQDMLNNVFYHAIDGSYGDQSVQDILNKIHSEHDSNIRPRC